MFWRRTPDTTAEVHPWALDRPLLHLGPHDAWTIRDACGGTLIFGDTGSGKTSGSGQAIALAMLRAGFGGLVMTVKASETERWREYARRCDRERDLVVFSIESGERFNFLEYEHNRSTRGGGMTRNLVELFVTAASVAREEGGSSGHDPFWEKALRQILSNTIDALRLAGEPLTLSNLHRLIVSAPMNAGQVDDERWQATSYLFDTLLRARERVSDEQDVHVLRVTTAYWLNEFAETMDPRTRGNIVTTFTATADGFLRGDLHELLCTTTTITPEATLAGRIIVLDLPEKQFHDLGRVVQILWKYCWQRAMEETRRESDARPVFLWADEAQNFVTPREPTFLQTAREQKACCVYLTQSISNYGMALGQGQRAAVSSLIGGPKTKIFHCNGDAETNNWAERTIADNWETMMSTGRSDHDEGKQTHTFNTSSSRAPRVRAAELQKLRCGGPPDFRVEAILFQSGRRFRGGDGNIMRLSFLQNPELVNQRSHWGGQ